MPKTTKKPATTVKAPTLRVSRARSWFAGVFVTVAVLLLPTAIVGNWASVQISNTNTFVNTLAPLAKNPAVQKVIVTAISTEINKAINVDKITAELADGIGTALKLPPALQKLVNDLSGPLANGVESLISDTVAKVVASPAFDKAFTASLTFTHNQLIALLSNSPDSVVVLDRDGTLSLPLGPLVETIKQQLVEQKVPFAKLIPSINATVPIAKVPDLVAARIAYQVGVGIGFWLPWVVFALFAASIALARKHWRQLMVVGIVSFITAGVVAIGIAFGRIVLVSLLSPTLAAASSAVYESIIAFVATASIGLLILSGFAILAGAVFGLASTAGLRAWFSRGFVSARDGLDGLGVKTGAFGLWLNRHRVAVRVGILVVLGGLALLCGPMHPSVVIGTVLLASGLLVSSELLARTK